MKLRFPEQRETAVGLRELQVAATECGGELLDCHPARPFNRHNPPGPHRPTQLAYPAPSGFVEPVEQAKYEDEIDATLT